MSPLKHSNNIAARMGRWSANHWKTAVFGWLAFVVAAFAIGNAVGTKYLETSDTSVGEARQADKIVDAGFPETDDEMGEIVLIQSKTLNATTPPSGAVIQDVTTTLDGFPKVTKLHSPLEPGHADQISKDGRSVMVTVQPEGRLRRGPHVHRRRSRPPWTRSSRGTPASRSTSSAASPPSTTSTRRSTSMLAKAGMIAIPLTLVILLLVFGSVVAAARAASAGDHGRLRHDRTDRASRASSSRWTSRSPRSSCSSASRSASTTRSSTSGASAKSVRPGGARALRSRPPRPPPAARS